MFHGLDFVQLLNMLAYAALFILSLRAIHRSDGRWAYMAPFLLVAVHATIFYLTVEVCGGRAANCGLPFTFTVWSQALRLHEALSFTFVLYILCWFCMCDGKTQISPIQRGG